MTTPISRQITTLCGVGYLRPASGTWGSLVALLLGLAIDRFLGFPFLLAATAGMIWAGFWACRVELQDRPTDDPSEIVVDELAGQWIALLFPAAAFWWMGKEDWAITAYPGWMAAFVFFRLFDISKPWLAGRADRKGGPEGVMMDDIWAGLFAGVMVIFAAGLAHGVLMR